MSIGSSEEMGGGGANGSSGVAKREVSQQHLLVQETACSWYPSHKCLAEDKRNR